MFRVIFSLAVLVAMTGFAYGATSASIGSMQGSVPVVQLTLIQGEEGESKESVVRRAALYIQAYSRRTTMEACGMIWRNTEGTRWAIPVTTSEAHAMCAITTTPVANMQVANETIHSHPDEPVYRVNKVDRMVSGFKMRLHSVQRTEGRTFSPNDLKVDVPGYLVTGGQLLHKTGSFPAEITNLGTI